MNRDEFMQWTSEEIELAIGRFRNSIMNIAHCAWANGKKAAEIEGISEIVKAALEQTKPADVRPVVFCKDCRHSYDEPGARVCSYGPCVDSIVADDFFCADGERREGGADG